MATAASSIADALIDKPSQNNPTNPDNTSKTNNEKEKEKTAKETQEIKPTNKYDKYVPVEIEEEPDIIKAAYSGDLEALKKAAVSPQILRQTRSKIGATPLHYAAVNDHVAIVEWLISQQVEVDASIQPIQGSIIYFNSYDFFPHDPFWNKKTLTPLQLAITHNAEKTVRYLVEIAKADLQEKNPSTLLLPLAADLSVPSIMKFLLEKYYKTNAERKVIVEALGKFQLNSDSGSLLLAARSLELLEYYIGTLQANYALCNEDGNTLLHFIACFDIDEGIEVTKYLLAQAKTSEEKNKLLNYRNKLGNSPLLEYFNPDNDWMSGKERKKFVRFFLEELKVDVHQKNNEGNTLLHRLDYDSKDLMIVRYLIEDYSKKIEERRALVYEENNEGNIPLLCCNTFDNVVRTYYLSIEIDIFSANAKGETLLHLFNGERDELEQALTKNPNDEDYIMPLPEYLLRGNYIKGKHDEKINAEKVKSLFDMEDNEGNTPFFATLDKGASALPLIKIFLKSRPDLIYQKNKAGYTFLHQVCLHNNQTDMLAIIKFLSSHLPPAELKKLLLVNTENNSPLPPIFLAIEKNNLEIIRYCIETLKIDINIPASASIPHYSLLIHAASFGHVQIVIYLLSHAAHLPSPTYDYKCLKEAASRPSIQYDKKFLDMLAAIDGLMQFASGALVMSTLPELLAVDENLRNLIPTLRNHEGDTLLHVAVSKVAANRVEALLDNGADLYAKGKDGKTALEKAEFMLPSLADDGLLREQTMVNLLVHEIKSHPWSRPSNASRNTADPKRGSEFLKEKIENIFHFIEKIKSTTSAGSASHKATLYLTLGKKFQELQLIEAAMRAYKAIPKTSPDLYRLAQAGLAELVCPPIGLEEQEPSRETRLQTQLKHLFEAGCVPESEHPSETSIFRTHIVNDFLGGSSIGCTDSEASPYYTDPCTPAGVFSLVTKHHQTLKDLEKTSKDLKMSREQIAHAIQEANELRLRLAKAEGSLEAYKSLLKSHPHPGHLSHSTKRKREDNDELDALSPAGTVADVSATAATGTATASTAAASGVVPIAVPSSTAALPPANATTSNSPPDITHLNSSAPPLTKKFKS